uniref:Cytochrome b561 domain-containing protein n=1 Tax=Alexandrium monilatum TaxID=311494 RepID=A0A7S4RZJ8_9DINO
MARGPHSRGKSLRRGFFLLAAAAVSLLLAGPVVGGFATPQPVTPRAALRPAPRAQAALVLRRRAGPLEVLREPLEAVAQASLAVNPALKDFPKVVLVWLHPVSQALIYIPFLYGAFLGLQVLLDKGDEVVALPAPIGSGSATAREAHPTIMKWVSVVFLFFAIGGIINLVALDQKILESNHSTTAALGLGLLAVQGGLSLLFGLGSFARIAHSLVGTVTVFVLLVHAFLGVGLGSSL